MKKLLVPIIALLAATILVLGQAVNFSVTVNLTQNQARGLQLATQKYNAVQRAADTNWVDRTPQQYLTGVFQSLISDYNKQYDAETFAAQDVKTLWENATQAQRDAAIAALQ